MMLLLFTSRGCPACTFARGEFENYKRRNPLQMAIEMDADGPWAQKFVGKQIRATPLYVLELGDQGNERHEGALKVDALEKWVKGITATL